MKKILITAFGAFAGNEENYSEKAVKLASTGSNVRKCYLPVGFTESPAEAEKYIAEDDYDVILLVGEAGARDRITIEKIAINWKEATIADNFGAMPAGERLEEGAPDGIFSTVDVAGLVGKLREKGVTVSSSFTAGTFVCNALYWSVLRHHADKEVVFIHVPRKDEGESARALSLVSDILG